MKVQKEDKSFSTANFDRVMVVEIHNTRSAGAVLAYKFAPSIDSKYNTRMEATIDMRPNMLGRSSSVNPGLTASVRIYNPGDEIYNYVQKHTTWASNYKGTGGFAKYNATRPFVVIKAGYVQDGKENISRVFGGYLNSSAQYRKGPDVVCDLYCHDVMIGSTSVEYSTAQLGQTVQDLKFEYVSPGERSDISWDSKLRELIRKYETEITTLYSAPKPVVSYTNIIKEGTTVTGTKNSMLEPTELIDHGIVELTDSVRKNPDWFRVNYVVGKTNSQPHKRLRQYATAHWKPKKEIVLSADGIQGVLNELASQFPGPYGVVIERNLVTSAPYNVYDVYPVYGTAESGSKGVIQKDKTTVGVTHTIYNYQNFLETPIVDASGAFTIKMMLHAVLQPGDYLKIAWDDKLTRNMGAISNSTKGVELKSGLAQYYATLQMDKSLNVKMLTETNGYIFNRGYYMTHITHALSTHGSEWTTTVKTAPGWADIGRKNENVKAVK